MKKPPAVKKLSQEEIERQSKEIMDLFPEDEDAVEDEEQPEMMPGQRGIKMSSSMIGIFEKMARAKMEREAEAFANSSNAEEEDNDDSE